MFKALLSQYGFYHKLATSYHLQASGLVEMSKREINQILAKNVNASRIVWSRTLDVSLWVYRTAFKTLIDLSTYHLVYGNLYHFPVELGNKDMWVLKKLNMDRSAASCQRVNDINGLNESLLKQMKVQPCKL